VSGGLAFAVIALISSGLVRIFDHRAIESLSLVVGLGFLVGYFSDSAVAKLSEIADTLFGTTCSKSRHKEEKEALQVSKAEIGKRSGDDKPGSLDSDDSAADSQNSANDD
jgi:hypothetical protein